MLEPLRGQPSRLHQHSEHSGKSKLKILFKFALCSTLLTAAASVSRGQFEGELTARRHAFPGIGSGLRAVKRGADGRIYILTAQALLLFDASEHKLLTIATGSGTPATDSKSTSPETTFAEDFDISGDGKIYVADRAANRIAIYSSDGRQLQSIAVNAPASIAALPDGEVAVSTMHEPHLITVFDKSGREIREFGEFEDISSRADLNRFLNAGFLSTDALGHLYYAFVYTPEPTVRQYDANGYAALNIQYAEIDAFATAQAARKEIERQERRGKQPAFKPITTALAVVRSTGEVWIALHNRLLRFDKDGNRQATYQLYTPEGARLDAATILVDDDRLLIGTDQQGIFEFERPDLKLHPSTGTPPAPSPKTKF
jgi:hypothetical protein